MIPTPAMPSQRTTLFLCLSLSLSTILACEGKSGSSQATSHSIVGSWKSTDAYSEGTIKFKIVEVVNFASDGTYDGYTKTFENSELSEHERFSGRYKLTEKQIHWSPGDDDPWTDQFELGAHELTFQDQDGDTMNYIRIGD